MQWFSEAMRKEREAADERYRRTCRLNALEIAGDGAPAARRPVRETPKTPVTPRATATAAPVRKRIGGRLCEVRSLGPGKWEERYLDDGVTAAPVTRRYRCQYGGSDERR